MVAVQPEPESASLIVALKGPSGPTDSLPLGLGSSEAGSLAELGKWEGVGQVP